MSYCETIDATPPAKRWHLVRGLMRDEPHPFFAEMRERRPVLALPNLTLAFRYADCALILRRHDDFGVDLYRPKQGDYFMAQDDTADHWRDKAIMRSILDFEEIPAIRAFVGEHTHKLLKAGKGRIDLAKSVGRAVPIAVVRAFFGLEDGDPADLAEISYWNQQDAFHNQPFDESPDATKIVAEREKANIRLGLLIATIVAKKSIPAKLGLGGEDSVTRLLKLSFSGGVKFSVKKVLFNAGGLLIGAVETTSHCINNVFAELFSRPEALAAAQIAARRGPPAASDAVALEALRLRPAFPYFFRTCHKATELSGGSAFAAKVTPGTTVLAVTQSAMSDPASFAEPTRFDVARSQGDNFVFGYGLHECLGRAVAREMLGEMVRQLLLLPGLAAAGPVEFRSGVPESFPLRWAA